MRLTIALLLVIALGSANLAQEKPKASQPQEEVVGRGKSRQRKRGRYGRGNVSVNDPAKFKSEGKQIFSGPQPGEKLPGFEATSLVGDEQGESVDPVALGGKHPELIVFEDENGVAIRGLFGLARAAQKIRNNTDKKFHFSVVFLSDDADTVINRYAELFPRLQETGIDSISISKDGRNGPGTYGLDRTVSQTILFAKDGKVTRNFVFPQGMLYPDPHVLGGIAELIDVDREKVAAWLAEGKDQDRMQMQRDDPNAAAKRNLRNKIGEFVRAGKLTREEAGQLYDAAFPEKPRR